MSIDIVTKLVIAMVIWAPKSHNFCQALALFLVRNSFHLFNQHSTISQRDDQQDVLDQSTLIVSRVECGLVGLLGPKTFVDEYFKLTYPSVATTVARQVIDE
jgi:hypothetical protein